MSDWIVDTLGRLTLDQKLSLLSGRDLWHTQAVERLGIPALRVTDGPNGARGPDGNHGPPSTSFPVGVAMGATWDPELIEAVGRALAHETAAKGASVLLGPTVNIPRVPNAGRNFECFSEDPLLSGSLAAAWIHGLQDEGIGACLKHFVCNDQEHDRHSIDVRVDERTLREIYLEPFRIAVEGARPWAVMSAYNTINGTTASEHPMLDDVLRAEWGFDGLVMSDWYGTYGPDVATSGLDLEMPGPGRWMHAERLQEADEAGELPVEVIDRKVSRLLALHARTGAVSRAGARAQAGERPQDRDLARRLAVESTVLLVNRGALPLARPARIAVIGELADETPHQGGGSSSVNPHRVVSILEGVRAAADDAEVVWEPGCRVRRFPRGLDPARLGDDGLLVEYFAGPAPNGAPVRSLSSWRSYLSFFGGGDEWVDYEQFAVRVSGIFVANTEGRHEFGFGAGGRLRVRLDGDLVIDGWEESESDARFSVDLAESEAVEISVEYASLPGTTWRWLSLGCDEPGPEVSIASAAAAAAQADVAVVVVGLTPQWESEGFDRPDLRLPAAQDDLLAAVAARQPNTVVVVTAGSAIEMPWADDVAAILHAWYGGQEVGHAVADVLFGRADPGGRLPVTFPADSRQHPGLLNYPGEGGRVRYGEGVYVGYRAFDRLGLRPRFAFGHGLSYSTFEVDVDGSAVGGAEAQLDVVISNTGGRPGTEVVQVYALDVGGVQRRLVAFEKVRLEAGETRRSAIRVPLERLRTWDASSHEWRSHSGVLRFEVVGGAGSVVVDLGDGTDQSTGAG